MAQIIIKDLKFYGFHGVYPEEQVVGTTFRADVTLDIDDDLPGFETDRIEDTVNYEGVIERIIGIGTRQKYHLIERLAEVIGEELLEVEHVCAVDVVIYKSVSRLTPEPQWIGVRRRIRKTSQGVLAEGR